MASTVLLRGQQSVRLIKERTAKQKAIVPKQKQKRPVKKFREKTKFRHKFSIKKQGKVKNSAYSLELPRTELSRRMMPSMTTSKWVPRPRGRVAIQRDDG
eukprot:1739627-Karenia_brevis.AAC.1